MVENTRIPSSSLEGGELFVEAEAGQYRLEQNGALSQVLPITLPFTSFLARRKHAVLPWKGDRFRLGTYHIRNHEWLPTAEHDLLVDLCMKPL